MTNSYNYSVVPNNINLETNTNITYNYQVLYISWGVDTILHIYDCTNTNNINIGSYLFRQSVDPVHYLYRGNLSSPIGSYVEDTDRKNNAYEEEALYDKYKQNELFQVSTNVLFDTTNRYLVIRKNNGISVYDGTLDSDGNPNAVYSNIMTSGKVLNTPAEIVMTNFTTFQPLYIPDPNGSNFVLYIAIPSTKKTMIAVISMDPNIPGLLKIKNVITFNQDSHNVLDGNNTIVPSTDNRLNPNLGKSPASDTDPVKVPETNYEPETDDGLNLGKSPASDTEPERETDSAHFNLLTVTSNLNENKKTTPAERKCQSDPPAETKCQSDPPAEKKCQSAIDKTFRNYVSGDSNERTCGKDHSRNTNNIPSLDSIISDYYSKYWNDNLPVSSENGVKQYSSDFLLKTKIVPPICPACSSNTTCGNCKGNQENSDTSGNNPFDLSYNDISGNDYNDVSGNDEEYKYEFGPIREEPRPEVQRQEPRPAVQRQEPRPAVQRQGMGTSITNERRNELQRPTFENRIIPEGVGFGSDPYNYNGALSEKQSSDYKPIGTDLSKFN
jgi:hypothetical protein